MFYLGAFPFAWRTVLKHCFSRSSLVEKGREKGKPTRMKKVAREIDNAGTVTPAMSFPTRTEKKQTIDASGFQRLSLRACS